LLLLHARPIAGAVAVLLFSPACCVLE